MGKFSDFLKKDFKIVENRKYLFLVPIVIVLIAMIFMVCFINAEKDANAAFNLGMDFTGGYKVTVKLGEKIQNDNYNELVGQLNDSFDNVELEGGAKVKVRKIKITTQSSGSDKAFVISFQKPANVSEEQMEEYNEALAQEIEKTMFNIVPSVSISGQDGTVSYDNIAITDNTANIIKENLNNAGYTVVGDVSVIPSAGGEDRIDGVISFKATIDSSVTTLNQDELVQTLTIADLYAGRVINSGKVSGSVSDTLLWSAIGAIAFAVVLMFIYIVIRFIKIGVSAAIATIVALLHDVIIMFCFMAIFRIELGSSFIAGLVTILGYSINNTIVIFDRVRENNLLYMGKLKPVDIANKSVKETFWRSVNTTFTTLTTIVCLAILCVTDVQIFALPIIAGLLAGAYSSMVIAPSIWATMQQAKLNKIKKALKNKRA